ncbi:MAG: FAD-binding protein [Devosia sp.]
MTISRRTLLQRTAGVGAMAAFAGKASFASAQTTPAPWPAADAWDSLRKAVGGRLIEVADPLAPCRVAPGSTACQDRLAALNNPFFTQDQPGALQSNGWYNAWTREVSPYAVAAQSAEDIVAAVNFAREHGVRLVVKGAGHDYLGRNMAPDSLLVWTHPMREVTFHPTFKPAGAPDNVAPVKALSAQAGTRWIEAYQVASDNDRYVQGGGCTSVGVAGGFIQGGGYGSFSKRYGTGAGSVLEFEVVTAAGDILTANAYQNEDLFWALRGGGGGTFGIVSKITLLTHERPTTAGLLSGSIKAADESAFRDLIAALVAFYPGALNNPTWGEQISIRADNSVELTMTFLDITEEDARSVWRPVLDGLRDQANRYTVDVNFRTWPFSGTWDMDEWLRTDPSFITRDTRKDAEPGIYWWTSNQGEVSEYIESYQSIWLPFDDFAPDKQEDLSDLLFKASRHANVRLQINKGLSGASKEVLARERETSVHPAVRDAAAIIIIATRQPGVFPGVPNHEPDYAAAKTAADGTNAAMAILRAAYPEGGTYGNECDYFQADWKHTLYGEHYDRLLAIKRKVDPTNLLRVHHGVGSDA